MQRQNSPQQKQESFSHVGEKNLYEVNTSKAQKIVSLKSNFKPKPQIVSQKIPTYTSNNNISKAIEKPKQLSTNEVNLRTPNQFLHLKSGFQAKLIKTDLSKYQKDKKIPETIKKPSNIKKDLFFINNIIPKNSFEGTNDTLKVDAKNTQSKTKFDKPTNQLSFNSGKMHLFAAKGSPSKYFSEQSVYNNIGDDQKPRRNNSINKIELKQKICPSLNEKAEKSLSSNSSKTNSNEVKNKNKMKNDYLPRKDSDDRGNFNEIAFQSNQISKNQRKNNSSVPANKDPIQEFQNLNMKIDPFNFNMSGHNIDERSLSGKNKDMSFNRERIFQLKVTKDPFSLKKIITDFFTNNPKGNFKTNLDFYGQLVMIGKGTYGKVYETTHRLTDKKVAIKCFEKTNIKNVNAMHKIFNEVEILSNLFHPNIIKLYEIFENDKYYFFVTEYAQKGDLLKILQANGPFNETQVFLILKDLIHVCQYLKSKGILHRDIKLDNILLDDSYRIKICDFGISVKVDEKVDFTEKCGTPAYMSPEVIQKCYKGFLSDVFLKELEYRSDFIHIISWRSAFYRQFDRRD